MKIVSWNVNGIRSVYSKNFLKHFKLINADIFCLQEIKAQEVQFPAELKDLNEYNLYTNCGERKGYSGVAVFSKTKPNTVLNTLGIDRFDREGRFLQLDFDKFSFIDIYIPNGNRDQRDLPYKFEVYDKLTEYLTKLSSTRDVVISGDFNIAHQGIDLARPKQNLNNVMFTLPERKKVTSLLDSGFIDTFRIFNKSGGYYSWWAYYSGVRERNIGWRIDYVLASKHIAPKIREAFILKDVTGSDHCPVGIQM